MNSYIRQQLFPEERPICLADYHDDWFGPYVAIPMQYDRLHRGPCSPDDAVTTDYEVWDAANRPIATAAGPNACNLITKALNQMTPE